MQYIIIAGLLILLELAYFRIASRFNIIDRPNLRSSHTSITLRGGGIIFLFGAWLFWIFFGFKYTWFIIGLTLIGITSLIDDINSLSDRCRLIVQFISMFLMFYQLNILRLDDWWMVIIALIVCVGIINAYNFMDGINGITGGYSLSVLIPLIYLNIHNQFIIESYLIVIAISLLIFCFFNFRIKARCFAGDVGSVSIAFLLLFAVGKLIIKTKDFSYIVFLAVYGADTILTIIHRIKLHENLGEAHRKHAYQIMANELKISHPLVSSFYIALQLLISAGIIFLPLNHYIYLGIIVLLLTIGYIIFIHKYYYLHENYLKSKQ